MILGKPQMEGFDKVRVNLAQRAVKYGKQLVHCRLTYEAPYAIYVHENLEAYHRIGQAKYLEEPLRLYRADMQARIASELKAGKTLEQALRLVLNILKNQSQKLVPVDTGFLKSSAKVETV